MAARRDPGIQRCSCEEWRRSSAGAVAKYHGSINRVRRSLDERRRRQFAGLLAVQHGYGGIQEFARGTGMSRRTILRGQREVEAGQLLASTRMRAPGVGRQWSEKNNRVS